MDTQTETNKKHSNLEFPGDHYTHQGTPVEKCELCNGRLGYRRLVAHHLSYEPEKIVFLCQICHTFIHHLYRYTEDEQKIAKEWIILYGHLWDNGFEKFANSNYRKSRGKREYWQNPEKARIHQREYRKKHPDWFRKYSQKYEEKHKEERKEYSRLYRLKNLERLREYDRKRRLTESGKERYKEYEKSERGRAVGKKYERSEKGKVVKKRYSTSEKGKLKSKRWRDKNPNYSQLYRVRNIDKLKEYDRKKYALRKINAIPF